MSTNENKRFTKKERSWILYDWANSVYATNIMAAIFPTIFVAFAGDAGDQWWGYGTSIATFLIAILIIVLIGVSRVYLGVHYASDVIAGFCLAAAWLALYTTVVAPIFLPEKKTKLGIDETSAMGALDR